MPSIRTPYKRSLMCRAHSFPCPPLKEVCANFNNFCSNGSEDGQPKCGDGGRGAVDLAGFFGLVIFLQHCLLCSSSNRRRNYCRGDEVVLRGRHHTRPCEVFIEQRSATSTTATPCRSAARVQKQAEDAVGLVLAGHVAVSFNRRLATCRPEEAEFDRTVTCTKETLHKVCSRAMLISLVCQKKWRLCGIHTSLRPPVCRNWPSLFKPRISLTTASLVPFSRESSLGSTTASRVANLLDQRHAVFRCSCCHHERCSCRENLVESSMSSVGIASYLPICAARNHRGFHIRRRHNRVEESS